MRLQVSDRCYGGVRLLGNPEKVPSVLVLDALGRVERSESFRTAKNLGKILRICVEGTLAGKVPTAAEIAKEILTAYAFKHDPKGGGVRVQAKTLRTKLETYQKEDGAQELVWIDLPDGAYEAKFRYNPKSEIMEHMRRADAYRAGLVFCDEAWTRGAFYEVWEVLTKEPRYPLAYPAIMEDWTRFSAIFDLARGYKCKYSLEGIYKRDIFRDLAERAGNECESFLILAGLQALGRSWDAAKMNFETARKIDAAKTEGSLWYAMFLLLTGEIEPALEISRARIKASPERDDVRMCHLLFLFLTRSYEEMPQHIWARVTSTPESLSVAMTLSAYASISKGAFAEAAETLKKAATQTFDFVTEWSHLGALIYCYTKLIAECHGNPESIASMQSELHQCFNLFDNYPNLGGLQRMFMYQARGSGSRAITALRSACLAARPAGLIGSALWYWPFLDEYRDHPRFAHLAKRLNIPDAQRIASEKLLHIKVGRSI